MVKSNLSIYSSWIMALKLYVRNLYLTQGHRGIFLCFLKAVLWFYSLHLDLCFILSTFCIWWEVWIVLLLFYIFLFAYSYSIVPITLVKKITYWNDFFTLKKKNQLSFCMGAFLTLYSAPFIYFFHGCLDNYSYNKVALTLYLYTFSKLFWVFYVTCISIWILKLVCLFL